MVTGSPAATPAFFSQGSPFGADAFKGTRMSAGLPDAASEYGDVTGGKLQGGLQDLLF